VFLGKSSNLLRGFANGTVEAKKKAPKREKMEKMSENVKLGS